MGIYIHDLSPFSASCLNYTLETVLEYALFCAYLRLQTLAVKAFKHNQHGENNDLVVKSGLTKGASPGVLLVYYPLRLQGR